MVRRDITTVDQASAVVRGCYYNIRQLRIIRNSPTREVLRDAGYALMLSRVDCRNWPYVNSPHCDVRRLQAPINMPSRIVSGRSCFGRITDYVSNYLHWLPVPRSCEFQDGHIGLQGEAWSRCTLHHRPDCSIDIRNWKGRNGIFCKVFADCSTTSKRVYDSTSWSSTHGALEIHILIYLLTYLVA